MSPEGILDRIRSLRALVVGDICLDRWCTYAPGLAEPSRETGLPRVAVVRTEITAGGGGTVANNCAALGAARVAVLGVRGGDGHGYELGQALARAGIDASLMIEAPVATFTYTKLLNSGSGEEDRGRIDYVNPDPLPAGAARAVVEQLLAHAAGFDVILVSDQAETRHEGVVTSEVREALARLGHPLVWVDSRMRAELFRGVLVKPNEREAQEACTRLGVSGYRALREVIGYPRLFVTHGDRGVLVLDGESETWVSTRAVQKPVDICGAGDSFSAGAALALAAGATPVEAARFGNLVTSITIMKKGTGTASPAEVMQAAARIAEQGPHP